MFNSKILILSFLIISLTGIFLGDFSQAQENYICAVYFTGVGCPHCARTDPVVLDELLKKDPNLIIVEYEIYQKSANAPLLYQYNSRYNSGLGIPLIIFNKDNYIIGDRPILDKVENKIKTLNSNGCSLIDGSQVDFSKLDIASLPGLPKIWRGERILIKEGDKGDSDLLRNLLLSEDLSKTLENIKFKEIKPEKVALSGRFREFKRAIKIDDWIFQWNEENSGNQTISPLEAQVSQNLPPQKIKPNLTFLKVISLAAVDAVNPCALAVLALMLLAIMTYNPKNRRNILFAGLAFVFSVFIVYLIYGLVIIKSFQIVQSLTFVRLWLYKVLAVGALILGVFKIRDFFQPKRTCKVTPKVDKFVSKVTSPKGAFLLGIFVTIFLLPCTIGPYIICGGMLSALSLLKTLPWLLLYNLVFILPMIAVVFLIYFGLSGIEDISSWQARNMRYLDLISGLIMLALGFLMLFGLI